MVVAVAPAPKRATVRWLVSDALTSGRFTLQDDAVAGKKTVADPAAVPDAFAAVSAD